MWNSFSKLYEYLNTIFCIFFDERYEIIANIYGKKKVEIYHNKPLSIIQILHQNFENFQIFVTLIRII